MWVIALEKYYLEMLDYFLEYFFCILDTVANLNVGQVLWWIYVSVLILLLLLSSFGRQLGLRRKYTQYLLKVFEFGYSRVQKKRNSNTQYISQQSEDDSEMSFPSSIMMDISNQDVSLESLCDKNFERYKLSDIFSYVSSGISTIVDDEVTPQFVSEELPYWNLLSRTNNRAYEFISFRLTFCWMIGFIVRYFLLFPLRICIFVVGLLIYVTCSILVSFIPNDSLKRKINKRMTTACFDYTGGCLSLVATFHDTENKPEAGIVVANHTSPIDAIILATDNFYDMVSFCAVDIYVIIFLSVYILKFCYYL